MWNDPRFHRIVRIIFWGSLLFTIALAAALFFARFNEIERAARPKGDPIELEEQAGRAVVPEAEVPQSLQSRLSAPSITLLPSRVASVRSSPVPPREREAIIRAANRFVFRWDTFSPGDVYSPKLSDLVRGRALSAIAGRDDVLSDPDICPDDDCVWGLIASGTPELLVADYDGRRAYVAGYGAVQKVGFVGDTGTLYSQAYGLILYRSGDEWLVERAAAETLGKIGS